MSSDEEDSMPKKSSSKKRKSSLKKKKSSKSSKSDSGSGSEKISDEENEEEEDGKAKPGSEPETASVQSKRSLSQRFLSWTMRDLFDFNPRYLASLRGILHIFHMIFAMFVVALVGSACHSSDAVNGGPGWYCRQPDTFTFVVACSAFVHSVLFFLCCMLSKKADRRLLVTSYEVVVYVTYAFLFLVAACIMSASKPVRKNRVHIGAGEVVYYVTYAIFFLIATCTISSSKAVRNETGHYHVNVGAGVFDLLSCIVYTCSAVWFGIYHTMYANKADNDLEAQEAMD